MFVNKEVVKSLEPYKSSSAILRSLENNLEAREKFTIALIGYFDLVADKVKESIREMSPIIDKMVKEQEEAMGRAKRLIEDYQDGVRELKPTQQNLENN
jgi:hypothetical protein